MRDRTIVRFIQTTIILISLIFSFSAKADQVIVNGYKTKSFANRTRILVTVSNPFHYHSFKLQHPYRIVVDIENAKLSPRFAGKIPLNKSLISIRAGEHKHQVLRLVLDLKHPVYSDVFDLTASPSGNQRQLIIDLYKQKPKTQQNATKKLASIKHITDHKIAPRPVFFASYHSKKKTPVHKNKMMTTSKKIKPHKKIHNKKIHKRRAKKVHKHKKLRNVIIIIDPGHGGKDPGAIGPNGFHEKNIVFKISRMLQKEINKKPGFVAKLTRHGDYYLTLRERLAIARKYRADMFIAIHADAYPNRSASGASVFALSQRGATSEAARWLAKKENESELVGGVNLTDKTSLLKSVLISLSQAATIRSSLHIGENIIKVLSGVGKLHHQRVEQAAFVVLKSPDIPSLLIETGFISTPKEEKRLVSNHYQELLASAIMHGACQYFIHSPPRNTWLAAHKYRKNKVFRKYVVIRGDTLQKISLKFNVAQKELIKINQLHSDILYVGQSLMVPMKLFG